MSGIGQGLPEISSSLPVPAAHRLARANKIPGNKKEFNEIFISLNSFFITLLPLKSTI